jgi:hypothetical protein
MGAIVVALRNTRCIENTKGLLHVNWIISSYLKISNSSGRFVGSCLLFLYLK